MNCRPPIWEMIRKDLRAQAKLIHALTLKVAAVAIRDVTILHELRDLANDFRHRLPESRLDITIGPARLKKPPKGNMTTIELNNDQEIDVTIAPKTSKGKPAKVDGVPTWEVVSGDTATVTPTADGKTATLRTNDDAEGDTVIKATADADLGEGVETLEEIITLRVSSPKATSLGVTVGEARDKTPLPDDGGGNTGGGDGNPPTARASGARKKSRK